MNNYPIYIQYSNSPNLINFTESLSTSLEFLEKDFANDYLNIKTATVAGLDNWGIILNQSRIVNSGLAYPGVFGFANGIKPNNTEDYPQNFNHGNFYNPAYQPSIILNDTEYRALLLLLYRKYTTNNSLNDLNNIIQEYALFQGILENKLPFVTSSYNMEITYTFPYIPEPYEINFFLNTDCLAVPAGVIANIIIL